MGPQHGVLWLQSCALNEWCTLMRMRTLCILAFVLAAVTSAQEAPKRFGGKSIATPGFGDSQPAVAPVKPAREGPQLTIWAQVRETRCAVPLVKAELKVEGMTVPSDSGKDTLPKVALPAPPCDNAPRVVGKPEVRTSN